MSIELVSILKVKEAVDGIDTDTKVLKSVQPLPSVMDDYTLNGTTIPVPNSQYIDVSIVDFNGLDLSPSAGVSSTAILDNLYRDKEKYIKTRIGTDPVISDRFFGFATNLLYVNEMTINVNGAGGGSGDSNYIGYGGAGSTSGGGGGNSRNDNTGYGGGTGVFGSSWEGLARGGNGGNGGTSKSYRANRAGGGGGQGGQGSAGGGGGGGGFIWYNGSDNPGSGAGAGSGAGTVFIICDEIIKNDDTASFGLQINANGGGGGGSHETLGSYGGGGGAGGGGSVTIIVKKWNANVSISVNGGSASVNSTTGLAQAGQAGSYAIWRQNIDNTLTLMVHSLNGVSGDLAGQTPVYGDDLSIQW